MPSLQQFNPPKQKPVVVVQEKKRDTKFKKKMTVVGKFDLDKLDKFTDDFLD